MCVGIEEVVIAPVGHCVVHPESRKTARDERYREDARAEWGR